MIKDEGLDDHLNSHQSRVESRARVIRPYNVVMLTISITQLLSIMLLGDEVHS